MSQRKTSKEEHYLLKLYELASAKGDPKGQVDRHVVGEAIGEHTKATDNIVQLLTKNNLTKKEGDIMIHLTDFGLKYVKENLIS
ncbi:MAG: hypothetical protein JSS30_07500 [Verrucomicrobia bacterium]|nr:hypothetical protein [Verrucomicrobiota bacterium]